MSSSKIRKTLKIVKLEQKTDKTLRGEFPKNITSPKDAADVLTQYIGNDDRESFVIILLDTKYKINCLHTVSTGSLNASIVTPRETFKVAIESNAAAIILGHNHPSGSCKPSQQDLQITKRLQEAGELLGISVLDHVIVGSESYISLKEDGYI